MRILFGAQGSIATVFRELDLRSRAAGRLTASAYWISDSRYYFGHRREQAAVIQHAPETLFEWDFTDPDRLPPLQGARCDELDAHYGRFELWRSIVADRRLMYGRLSKVRQSYAGRFSHDELQRIVYSALDAIDRLVERFRPDAIVTFVPATFGDYLLATVAKARGIRYLLLRSTKVLNYVTFADTLSAASSHITSRYEVNRRLGSGYDSEDAAKAVMSAARIAPLEYEGTTVPRRSSASARFRRVLRGLISAAYMSIRPANAIVAKDNHNPPPLRTWLHAELLRTHHESRSRRLMGNRQWLLGDADLPFVFFPLHSEPEIALSVYGRDHQNQIETIRRVAQSLPLRWKLVVKEHPRSMGTRGPGYYRRLLQIPNLVFADPRSKPLHWIVRSEAVVTISGFVGLEAMFVQKPVLVLGDASYAVLPDSMVRKVGALDEFSRVLSDLLRTFQPDDEALRAFVAACMSESVPVNLYSDLLAKPGRSKSAGPSSEQQYESLVELFWRRLRNEAHRNHSNTPHM